MYHDTAIYQYTVPYLVAGKENTKEFNVISVFVLYHIFKTVPVHIMNVYKPIHRAVMFYI